MKAVNNPDKGFPRVFVLRWGHRPKRDLRLTTHVALTARALGASGFILSDVKDEKVKDSVEKVVRNWGGPFFFEMGVPWRRVVNEWRKNGGIVVHLTAYGENIETSDVLQRIKSAGKDVLILVGSQKVPGKFFSESVSDFNVAIGNQPHSECASLAVFLDRFFEGRELAKTFDNAKLIIVPQARGKKIITN
ncbi:MAG: tRNA (cytidine(56)-2'-O)-methyltransferase [Candidatus Bathyarchaeota archaeon]|nr:tRNA (cytidine(56)-2'-O)-methyltransferase [Candidatus Bathyarchaeota archaeon]